VNILLRKSKSVILSSLLVAGIGLAIPVQEARASQIDKNGVSQKITIAGHGSARFDWLANQKVAEPVRVIKASSTRSLGNGTWICSAAGFGKQSKCHRR
jgi:hypothetical protein